MSLRLIAPGLFLGAFFLCGAVLQSDSSGERPAEKEGPQLGHIGGPAVAPGTSRFIAELLDQFDAQAAMDLVRYVDGFYRAPGNDGYNASLDRVRQQLEQAGFGKRPGYELEEILTPMRSPAWNPLSGKLSAWVGGGKPVVLHEFDSPAGSDRVMLPVHAPSADVQGMAVFDEENIKPGCIFVTERSVGSRSLNRFSKQGALAVLSSSNADFTVDPSGQDEHLDAIQFRTLSPSLKVPAAQISPRSHARLREMAKAGGELVLHFEAKVSTSTDGELRTLVALLIGRERPDEVVTIVAHVQEPGAGDNASGVGGLCQVLLAYARVLELHPELRPSRTLAFVWGDEMRQSAIWLNNNKRKVIAGLSADMLGQSNQRTGAICLLERAPDPGALDPLPPDLHTPWGAGAIREEDLKPSGLSLIARQALVDTATHVGGWRTSENPWEGGSDHDIFLGNGIPGILIWHFTDFTYHTGLDRLDRLDPEELRRTSCAILGAALGVADLRQADLKRLAASNALELDLRVASALAAKRPDVAKRWREWCRGVDEWLQENTVDSTND